MNSSIFQSANEGKDSSLAILCRTNHEVAQVFHSLRYQHPDLIIQNNTSYPLSRLRHIGVWNDILKRDLSLNGDYPLSEGSYEKLCVEYNKFNIPEITKSRSEDISLKRLFELCFQENSYPFLSHLIDLINTLDTDDLIRMEGYKHENLSKIVVSTIHKVKGLEFDEVLIAPSYANFPLDRHNYIKAMLSSNGAFQSAAEEARLLYVAMTRAKRKLTYWIGNREQSWLTLSVHQGRSESGKLLHGKPDEVGISWAWETTNWNENATATCRYIEENVRVGDKLKLGGRGNGTGLSIFHCDSSGIEHQIGFTSKVVGAGGRNSDLTVSAVLRCPYNGTPYFGGITNSEVVRRGWGHVVMASGVLR